MEEIKNLHPSNPEKYDTKFLIENEDNLDWEEISASKRRFSPAEIKLFGLSIKWNIYLFNHEMSENEIRAAVKYLSFSKFKLMISSQKLSESFMKDFKEKMDWSSVFYYQDFSEDFILEMIDLWKDIDLEELRFNITANKRIDIKSGRYDTLLLYLKLMD
jgi:hypothetical protein